MELNSHRYLAGFTLLILGIAAPVYSAVELLGVEGAERDNVLALLRLDDEPCDAPRRVIEQAFRRVETDIQAALEAFGYYDSAVTQSLRFESDCWEATIRVTLAEPVILRSVSLELTGDAEQDRAFAAFLQNPRLRSGQRLVHGDYEALKSVLSTLALERGYPDAQFAAGRIDVYPEEHAADIELRFDSGDRYRFGPILLDQSVLNDALIYRYFEFSEGDFYDSRLLAESRLELVNSGYFDAVNIVPGTPQPEGRVIPVSVVLRPSAKTQISYGIGLSTDTGARFRFGRNIRRFNPAGHQLSVNGLLSPVVTEASANYRMPYGDPRSEWISFDVGGKRENTDTSTSRSLQLGARRVLERDTGWIRTDSLNYLVEDFDVSTQSGRSRLLIPGLQWSRLRADDAIRPRNGSKLTFELRGAADSVISDTSFFQLVAEGKWIWTIGRSSRFLVRGKAGRIWENSFLNLPPSVRFFAGGDNSVRGFDFETIGPLNEIGEVIGGSRLITSSIEIEKQLKPLWSIALFADAGDAFISASPNFSSSVGIGARWRSPLGPIRVDIAKPQTGIERDVRLHISLGPDL